MPQLLTDLIAFLRSDYLTQLWWLIAGYALCYAAAFSLGHVPSQAATTILYRCRRGWGIAFLLHALAGLGVVVNWSLQNGMFKRFWVFFPCYLAVLALDLAVAIGLFSTKDRYVAYRE